MGKHTHSVPNRLVLSLLMGLLLWGGAASAQMATAVEPDRVRIGEEFVPRRLDLPSVLQVKVGQTVELPPDSTYDYIEVAGTLRVSRNHDTIVRFTHLLILPGGTLDAGTAADPVLRKVEFILRDVPIDLARDPFQWGNGLLNFGTQTRVGRAMQTWTTATSDLAAGATMLTVVNATGWQVGDALVIPDTAQPAIRPSLPTVTRREPTLLISAIAGNTITLATPLTFAHEPIRDPAGAVVLSPRVANLTRSFVIRSENPNGVRGHAANIGHHATWDIRHNQMVGLGRTRNETLDNTVADVNNGAIVQIGKNQVGRYGGGHDHHAHGLGSKSLGNVYDGLGLAKWAHAVHGTHDSLIEDEVAVDFLGACFVTEDGNEVRNVFRRNFCADVKGNNSNTFSNLAPTVNCPGCEGAGFWLRGTRNLLDGNEAWNTVMGINLINISLVARGYPSKPGGPNDAIVNNGPNPNAPIRFEGNVTAANTQHGLEYWRQRRFPVDRHISANNAQTGLAVLDLDVDVWLRDSQIVCQGGIGIGTLSSQVYTGTYEMTGGRIVGCAVGLRDGGAQTVTLRDVTYQNVTNIDAGDVQTTGLTHQNIQHVPLGANPPRFIVFGRPEVWNGTPRVPSVFGGVMWPQTGSRHRILNWQGTGQDYLLYTQQQRAGMLAFPSHAYNLHGIPEAGLTWGEAWAKYGLAFRGGVIADADITPLPGLITGVATRGLATVLGPPRCIVTFPSVLQPAIVEPSQQIRLYGLATGDPTGTNLTCAIEIDGGSSATRVSASQTERPWFINPAGFGTTASAPGTHTIKTWRLDSKGRRLPASEMTFQYLVAEATPRPSKPLDGSKETDNQ